MLRRPIYLVSLFVVLCGCTTTEPPSAISVEDAWLRPVNVETGNQENDAMDHETTMPMEGMAHETDMEPTAGNSAAYATLVNSGGADVLVSITTDAASLAEMHQTTMTDSIMRMEEVEQIDVPANGQVEFSPGGYHIMLNGITHTLAPGDAITLTFTFERAGAKQVLATVREP